MKGFKSDKYMTKRLEVSHERGETQKETLELDIDSLVKSTDDLSVKAEETGQLTLVNKSNAL